MLERPLTADEARVLGCLIEKETATPDAYPLTAKAVRDACNQSTSRDPVMTLTDHEVERALGSLGERGLTRIVHRVSNRVTKFCHVVSESLDLEPAETAIVAVLLLRGEQTAGELKTRTEPLHSFASTGEVTAALEALTERANPLVGALERGPGQKDVRWIELLSVRTEDADGQNVVDAGTSDDPYAVATAEFYDLLATAHWERFGLQLVELLAGVDPGAGPIVDVGSGTGVGLEYLRLAVPGAEVFAIEPSRAMRTALHTRLQLDAELRRVTTVDPRPWARASPPRHAAAVIVSAVLGHLTNEERTQLWRYVADRLPPGAPAVVEILPPERPMEIPMTRYRELPVGRFVYEGWLRGRPAGEYEMNWTMEYRVIHGEEQVAVSTVRSRWRCVSMDELESEIAPFGLSLTRHEGCVVVRRPL